MSIVSPTTGADGRLNWEAVVSSGRIFESEFLCPDDGIGIRVGLRNQILGVRVSLGAPYFLDRKL